MATAHVKHHDYHLVDPSISDNSDNDGLKTITLSYTFYPVHEQPPKPLAASEPDKRKGAL